MKNHNLTKSFLLTSLIIFFTNNCQITENKKKSRDYIYLTGSSTISPLVSAVSEEFARDQNFKGNKVKTPIVEVVGSQKGIELFCLGTDLKYPDFVNSSRVIKENEIADCRKNNINEIIEIKIGFDGIVLAEAKNSKTLNLTKEHIFLALAENIFDEKSHKFVKNNYRYWSEIDEKLAKREIKISVPPFRSGTRDVFIDMVMEEVCLQKDEFVIAYPDREIRRKECQKIRSDSAVINEINENDITVQGRLIANKENIAITSYNFLTLHQQSLQAIKINNILPDTKTISAKKYQLSRPLYLYFKKQNLNKIPMLKEFIYELINKEAIGSKGYLSYRGLVAMDDKEILDLRKKIDQQLKAKTNQ